jgi:hypothetical protein
VLPPSRPARERGPGSLARRALTRVPRVSTLGVELGNRGVKPQALDAAGAMLNRTSFQLFHYKSANVRSSLILAPQIVLSITLLHSENSYFRPELGTATKIAQIRGDFVRKPGSHRATRLTSAHVRAFWGSPSSVQHRWSKISLRKRCHPRLLSISF